MEDYATTTVVLGTTIDWSLDQVVRAGSRIKVEPRHMRVLHCLVTRAGAVVSREELLATAWPEVIVADEALTQSISVLRRVLGDDSRHPRLIQTVPKKGYRLIPPAGEPAPPSAPAASDPEGRPAGRAWRRALGAVVALAVVCPMIVLLWTERPAPDPRPHQPLPTIAATSYQGREAEPALSPDGRIVAFVWNGPHRGQFDLWIKEASSENTRRLTQTMELETAPTWSPDGRRIAFARVGDGNCGILVLSLADGVERDLARCGTHSYPQLAFSPDGGFLAISDSDALAGGYRISLLSLRRPGTGSGPRRDLTPPIEGYGDRSPAFSPDGRQLAFVRWTAMGTADLHVVGVDGGGMRRLTRDGTWFGGVTWSPDGGSLIASSGRGEGAGLWRVFLDDREPVWLGVREGGAVRPSAAARAPSLVFERQSFDSDVWSLDLTRPSSPRPLVASTRDEGAPSLSPDGLHLAFVSDRSGRPELWTTRADGSSTRRLTDRGALRTLPPRWSPDGRSLIVAADPEGHGDLFVVPLDSRPGDPVRPIAPSEFNEIAPVFSADGEAILFMSDRGGTWRLWEARLGGAVVRSIVDLPLSNLYPSADGTSLYASRFDADGIWRIPLRGGQPELLTVGLSAADWGNWTLRHAELDYVVRDGAAAALARLDTRTGEVSSRGPFALSADDQGIAVSPDGRTLIFTRRDRSESDIHLIPSLR